MVIGEHIAVLGNNHTAAGGLGFRLAPIGGGGALVIDQNNGVDVILINVLGRHLGRRGIGDYINGGGTNDGIVRAGGFFFAFRCLQNRLVFRINVAVSKQCCTAADGTANQCTNQRHGNHGLTAHAALLFLGRLRAADVIAGHGIGRRNGTAAVVRILGLVVAGLVTGAVLGRLIGNSVAIGLILLIGNGVLGIGCCLLCILRSTGRLGIGHRIAGVVIISGCIDALLPGSRLLRIGMKNLIVVVFIAHNGTLLFASFCLRPYDNLKLCPNYRQTQNDI